MALMTEVSGSRIQRPDYFQVDINSAADADVDTDLIVHGLGGDGIPAKPVNNGQGANSVLPYKVTLTLLQPLAGNLCQFCVKTLTANTVVITKAGTGVGTGNANAHVRLCIEKVR